MLAVAVEVHIVVQALLLLLGALVVPVGAAQEATGILAQVELLDHQILAVEVAEVAAATQVV